MRGALVRPVLLEKEMPSKQEGQKAPSDANVVVFQPKETEINKYFALYEEAFAFARELDPENLLQLLLPDGVRIYLESQVLQIDILQEGDAYEVVREVHVPDEFAKMVDTIAMLQRALRGLTEKGPSHFKKNYDQDAMSPVFSLEDRQVMFLAMKATTILEGRYGDLRRDLQVLPPWPNKNPAT